MMYGCIEQVEKALTDPKDWGGYMTMREMAASRIHSTVQRLVEDKELMVQ